MHTVTIPGKLIISGEHAVVYGNPALAAAIDRYVQVRVVALAEPIIQFAFSESTQPLLCVTFSEFWEIFEKLKLNDQNDRVVTQLYDLPLYALGLFLQHIQADFTHGIRIIFSGDLPMGYGLGSSAAVVVGVLRCAQWLFRYTCTDREILQMAIQAEHLQHGRSSGLDPSVCLQGGVILYQQQEMKRRALKPWPVYLINTGQPLSSTGECVAWVKQRMPIQHLLEQFRAVTMACDEALMQSAWPAFTSAIRQNHHLLCELGVVPQKVQACIAELEKQNAAAKICGAGSVTGDQAGYLLTVTPDVDLLTKIVQEFSFTLEHVQLGVVI